MMGFKEHLNNFKNVFTDVYKTQLTWGFTNGNS